MTMKNILNLLIILFIILEIPAQSISLEDFNKDGIKDSLYSLIEYGFDARVRLTNGKTNELFEVRAEGFYGMTSYFLFPEKLT